VATYIQSIIAAPYKMLVDEIKMYDGTIEIPLFLSSYWRREFLPAYQLPPTACLSGNFLYKYYL